MASWDDGQLWDSGLLWDSVSPFPPSPVAANHKQTHKTHMKRQRFFPRTNAARPEWFGNFAAQIVIANAILGLPAGKVTNIVKDALYAKYLTGLWLTAVREFGPAATAAGTVQLQASNSSGSGTVTVKAGSDLVARRSGV